MPACCTRRSLVLLLAAVLAVAFACTGGSEDARVAAPVPPTPSATAAAPPTAVPTATATPTPAPAATATPTPAPAATPTATAAPDPGSTTFSYDRFDATGAAATAGSYAFLMPDGQSTSVVTTYEQLRTKSTVMRVNVEDGHGASWETFYDAVAVGDVVAWYEADDCWTRYSVTETPEPVTGASTRDFGVRWVTYTEASCGGTIDPPGGQEFGWSPPDIQSPDITAPVRHGPWLLVPLDWRGEVTGESEHPLPARTSEEARHDLDTSVNPNGPALPSWLPPWRAPSVPGGWTLGGLSWGDLIGGDPLHGYSAYYDNEGGAPALQIYVFYRVWYPARVDATPAGQWVIDELRVIDGNPVLLLYSPPANTKGRRMSTVARILDLATGIEYGVLGGDRTLLGSNIDATLAIALSMLPSPADGAAVP